MIFAQIKDGIVKNIVHLENYSLVATFATGFDYMIELDGSQPVGPGWKYENNQFSYGSFASEFPNLTPRQLRLGLFLSNILLSDIESAINSLEEPDRSLAQISWEYSVEYERGNPIVDSIALLLGLTKEQTDELWKFASTL